MECIGSIYIEEKMDNGELIFVARARIGLVEIRTWRRTRMNAVCAALEKLGSQLRLVGDEAAFEKGVPEGMSQSVKAFREQ